MTFLLFLFQFRYSPLIAIHNCLLLTSPLIVKYLFLLLLTQSSFVSITKILQLSTCGHLLDIILLNIMELTTIRWLMCAYKQMSQLWWISWSIFFFFSYTRVDSDHHSEGYQNYLNNILGRFFYGKLFLDMQKNRTKK